MKKTNKITSILSVVIILVLIVAMALNLTACKETKEDNTPTSSDTASTSATEIGNGARKFDFRVTDKDGKSTDFIVCTDKTIVGDALLEVGLIEGEKVQIVNNNNGERIETYVIKGERGSGCICLNGAAARKTAVGDIVIIMGYGFMDFEEAKSFKPWIVFPDTATNQLV